MEVTDTKKYKMLFLVALAVNLLVLAVWPEWCWVPLPFTLTYLVYALDWV